MFRLPALTMLFGVLACGSSTQKASQDPADASAQHDASAQPPLDEIEALVQEAVEHWDGVLHTNCQCLLAAGTFPSLDACVKPSASTPDWVRCGTMVLANATYERDRTLAAARCLRDELQMRDDCLSGTSCDSEAHARCEMGAMQCASRDPEILVAVLQACPDLGLLSRPLAPTDAVAP